MTRRLVRSNRACKFSVTQLEDRANPAPVLSYSTYMPAAVLAEAVDSAGNAYLAQNGGTLTKLNPTGTAAIYSTQLTGGQWAVGVAVDSAGDAFVLLASQPSSGVPLTVEELDPTGANVLYSYAIPGASSGGPDADSGWMYGTDAGIALDSAGNVYVTGVAGSGLPTTPGAYRSTAPDPNGSAFLAKLNPALSGSASVVYCTYLGGSGDTSGDGDQGTGVAVDSAGNAYITGDTASSNFPTTSGVFQRTLKGSFDAFVAKINPNLSGSASLVYATYLGGSGTDGWVGDVVFRADGTAILFEPRGAAIAVDGSGNAYITGYTDSTDFPVTSGAFQTKSGISGNTRGVAFVTKLNGTGSGLVYSTFLGTGTRSNAKGTSRDTYGTAVAIDSAGDAYVTGLTPSTSFPLVNPIQSSQAGTGDVFVSTLNPTGKSLLFSTYLGGPGSDVGMAIAVSPSNDTYVGGATFGTFPVTAGAYQTTGGSGFAAMIDPPVGSPHVLQGVSNQPPAGPELDATTSQLIDRGGSGRVGRHRARLDVTATGMIRLRDVVANIQSPAAKPTAVDQPGNNLLAADGSTVRDPADFGPTVHFGHRSNKRR